MRREREEIITNAPCPMPHAQCPMPHSPFPNAHYLGVLSTEGAGDAAGLGMGEAVAALLISSLY